MYDDFLCCPLCQEPFRSPKFLTCLHTFCSDCLVAYVDKVNSGETELTDSDNDPGTKSRHASGGRYGSKGVVCPVCEVISYRTKKVDEKFVESLPDNDFISSLLRAVDSCPHQQIVCSVCSATNSCGSGGSLIADVTPGQINVDTDNDSDDGEGRTPMAVAWCFDCREGLCEQCKNKHIQCPSMASHTTAEISQALQVSLEKRKQLTTPCPKHPEESVKYYCVNCRVLGCMECTVLNHKKHYCVSTKEAIKLYKPEIEGLKRKLRHYHNDMHEIKNAIPSYLEKAGQRCERDINEYFDKLVNMLRKKQEELLTELGQIRDVEDSKAVQSAELSDKYCRTAQRMHAMMRYLLKYGTETEILLHYEIIRKHDIMQQIIRQQDEKLARYTFYSGNIEQGLETSLATSQSLDVSYFRGDFVPKALRLCKNNSDKVAVKCQVKSNTKRTRLLLDDGDDMDTKPGGLAKMSSRSQSVSNIAILSSISDRRNSDISADDFTLNGLQKSNGSLTLTNFSSPTGSNLANKNRPTRQPPTRDKELERRLKQRKFEKPPYGSNLKTSVGMSKSVTDISLLLGDGTDDTVTISPVRSEVARRAKRKDAAVRPRPRSTIDTSGTITPESKEISSAFERLRRLANMDGQERKPAPDRSAGRFKRMSLYRPVSQRLGSAENLNRGYMDMSPDSASDSYLRSPTVMAVQDVGETDGKPARRLYGQLNDLDFDMEFTFDEELESASDGGNIAVDSNTSRGENQPESKLTTEGTEEVPDLEIPVVVSSDPVFVFNCRDSSVHNAAAADDDDGRYPAGVVCLADGNMVVADAADNSVKLFTPRGNFLDSFCLHGENPEPRDVTGTVNGQVAVLYHERHLIAFLSTKNKLCLETTVSTSKGYVAIAGYDQSHLVVTCVFPSSIDIIQMDGKVVRSIDMIKMVPQVDSVLFFNPWYISCSQKGEIIVSEHSKKFVLALTPSFQLKFVYKAMDDSLRSTRGVCVATHGNVLLVDEIDGNIRVISPLGSFLGFAFPGGCQLENPLNVAFGGGDKVVVLQKNGDVKVFKIEDIPTETGTELDCWELKI